MSMSMGRVSAPAHGSQTISTVGCRYRINPHRVAQTVLRVRIRNISEAFSSFLKGLLPRQYTTCLLHPGTPLQLCLHSHAWSRPICYKRRSDMTGRGVLPGLYHHNRLDRAYTSKQCGPFRLFRCSLCLTDNALLVPSETEQNDQRIIK